MYVFDNYYSIGELAKTAFAFALTKLFHPQASLIRRPFYMRGSPRIQIETGFRSGYGCRIEAFGSKHDGNIRIRIGKRCHIGDHVHIASLEELEIGDDCLIASHVFITDCSHGSFSGSGQSDPSIRPEARQLVSQPTMIGKRVWIGENVCVLMGAHIGDGCVVGANSVVTRSFPNGCIIAGAPAKILRVYDPETRNWIRS